MGVVEVEACGFARLEFEPLTQLHNRNHDRNEIFLKLMCMYKCSLYGDMSEVLVFVLLVYPLYVGFISITTATA